MSIAIHSLLGLNIEVNITVRICASLSSIYDMKQGLPLNRIQGNIIKSHGRKYVRLLFLRFDMQSVQIKDIKSWIRLFASRKVNGITSAAQQSVDADNFKAGKKGDSSLICFFLSTKAYQDLDLRKSIPEDEAFLSGMNSFRSEEVLQDQRTSGWIEGAFGISYTAMILIANDSPGDLAKLEKTLKVELKPLLVGKGRIHVEKGEKLTASFPTDPGLISSVDVFGFVDNISQPDLSTDEQQLRTVLYEESDGEYGSYLVFRKIRQNEANFRIVIKRLTDEINQNIPIGMAPPVTREFVEAQFFGRFRNGTPVTLFDKPMPRKFWIHKTFDYQEDDGGKCPFHAHIRKTNPRERNDQPSIVRRGIPYIKNKKNQGLLFMSYQKSITKQFEYIHTNWANASTLPNTLIPSGIDPLMVYQKSYTQTPQKWNRGWNRPEYGALYRNLEKIAGKSAFIFRFRGGEYFYAPSITYLKNL